MKNFVFNFEKFPPQAVPTNENFILPTDYTNFTNIIPLNNLICKIRKIRRPLKQTLNRIIL